ncbi:hypothetical protein [Hymenobacter pini]|uniref:hypothetical protein n=1 Tax=Hymenobacter pini TaxID=2880879 RepID=UPI001CF47100|nr:hypothetical protein [Hymenobacter pini]MCA8831056.1 hypothetical protein [Hymenobacter pini]
MTVWRLLQESERQFNERPGQVQPVFRGNLFATGAHWMFRKLHENELEAAPVFDAATDYRYYGYLKYASSLLAFLTAGVLLAKLHWLLVPLAVLAFYAVEVHFLFLFPLLLDQVKNPLHTSVRQTYRIGFDRALLWVLVIAVYMLSGLLKLRNPWRRWHIGCLSIILWYKHEVRDRVQS